MHAVLSVNDGVANVWGSQYVARQPQARRQVLIDKAPSVQSTKAKILETIDAAGGGGTVVLNVGHGVAVDNSTTDGVVDLAPNKAMRLGGLNNHGPDIFHNVFYDVAPQVVGGMSDLQSDLKFNPTSQRLKNFRVYQEIGDRFKSVKPRQVVFLTCRIGNATDFVRKIANDWQVVCVAYTRRVVLIQFSVVGKLAPGQRKLRTQITLQGREPSTDPGAPAEPIMLAEEELPFFPSDTIRIGPPLRP
jgi:hypothetical protein